MQLMRSQAARAGGRDTVRLILACHPLPAAEASGATRRAPASENSLMRSAESGVDHDGTVAGRSCSAEGDARVDAGVQRRGAKAKDAARGAGKGVDCGQGGRGTCR
jgi:hypothetical protein